MSFELEPAAAKPPASPAKAVFVASPDKFSLQEWVLEDGDEIVRTADIEAKAIQHCTEMVIHIKKATEQLRNDEIERKAREVVKVLPCSA